MALLAAYVVLESVHPGALTAPRPETIPEAIVVGNGPRALEMMAEGHDVDREALVRSEMLYQAQSGLVGQGPFEVTPLEAALMAQRIEVVGLLMHTGVDVSRSTRAACLARARLPEALPLLGIDASEASAPAAGGVLTCFVPAGR